MFSSILISVTVLASVHSFIFVAATLEPQITQAPSLTNNVKRQDAEVSSFILTDAIYAYEDLPEKIDPYAIGRGPQSGYNICNSSTQGIFSLCQTLIFNTLRDFCLYSSPVYNSTIGIQEAVVVAFCTYGHGARPIPAGAILWAQFMVTPSYTQIVGAIVNELMNLQPGDGSGGELDPHGADLGGNPLGAAVYSNTTSWAYGNYTQITSWNQFIGDNTFCLKACNPTPKSGVDIKNYCENRYDVWGCQYNAPYTPQENGMFMSCEGDEQDVVGTYTVSGTAITVPPPTTFTPAPYVPRTPASSNCKTYQSTDLYGAPSSTSKATNATASGTSTQAGFTPKSTKSSALSSIGFPPAIYAICLAMMAGVALVL